MYILCMTEICMIRHGETDWNLNRLIQGSTNIPLNVRGRAQARIVADHLAKEAVEEGEAWDVLYASPLSRAYDTAAAIALTTGLSPINTDRRLQERHFGEAEGMDISVRHEYYKDRPIPGAETREDIQARGFEVIEEIALRHPGKRILIVSHGGLIANILFLLSRGEIVPGDPPLKNACMNLFSYDGHWHIEWYNRVTPELEAITAGVI